jgi:hypothetical protein
MIWLISQFPELNCLEPAQRKQLLHGSWWTYLWMLLRSLIAAMFTAAIIAIGMTTPWAALLSGAAVASGLYFLQLGRIRRAMRKEIAAAFRGRQPPFCMRCGYDLRGSGSGRCPECGSDFS